ncbi:MAG: hypothetical protein ABI624_20585 [Casimicrobiaceae bacterium]
MLSALCANESHPLPLDSGFSEHTAHRGLGIYSPSETSECYLILANDRDETWFISNRHLRIVGVFPDLYDLRFPLQSPAERGCVAIRSASNGSVLEAEAA